MIWVFCQLKLANFILFKTKQWFVFIKRKQTQTASAAEQGTGSAVQGRVGWQEGTCGEQGWGDKRGWGSSRTDLR